MEGNAASGFFLSDPKLFIDAIVDFNGDRFETLGAITDYRRDPVEGRILLHCRMVACDGDSGVKARQDDPFVMKVKVQVPPRPASDDPKEPLPGPSATTAAEWAALQKFRDENVHGVPHLITKKCVPQGPHGPWPGGYTSYTVMTLMTGQDLMATKFWSLDDETKEEIRQGFLALLKDIWRLDIAPYDCALRNIIWDQRVRCCSIVDFEHYHSAKDPINIDETEEMQRWGIVQKPPSSHWAIEWGLIKEPNAY